MDGGGEGDLLLSPQAATYQRVRNHVERNVEASNLHAEVVGEVHDGLQAGQAQRQGRRVDAQLHGGVASLVGTCVCAFV